MRLETKRITEQKKRQERLEDLASQIEVNKNSRDLLEIQINETGLKCEEVQLRRDTSEEEKEESQEKTLDDLREKNNYLTSEV